MSQNSGKDFFACADAYQTEQRSLNRQAGIHGFIVECMITCCCWSCYWRQRVHWTLTPEAPAPQPSSYFVMCNIASTTAHSKRQREKIHSKCHKIPYTKFNQSTFNCIRCFCCCIKSFSYYVKPIRFVIMVHKCFSHGQNPKIEINTGTKLLKGFEFLLGIIHNEGLNLTPDGKAKSRLIFRRREVHDLSQRQLTTGSCLYLFMSKWKWRFSWCFLYARTWYFTQHCFICRPSDFTVSEDAGIKIYVGQRYIVQ